MRCSSRIVLTLATAFTAMTAVAAPRLQAAEPTTGAVPRSAPASLAELKAQYRRPETIPFPKDNPYTVEKATLGKKLYFDTRLSAANLLSCAACHSPAYGFGDGQARGIGHNMKQLGRRSPTIVNAAFGEIFMWDGRAASLEEQALGPIRADVEMNLPIDQLLEKLKGIAEYEPLFRAAFPKEGMKPETIAKAIATYQRNLVSGRAPFDAWVEGDERAIGEVQQAFKTPGLREITRRGPFMHDGSVKTLEAVIEHYNDGGVNRASRSELIKPLALSAQEKTDLVAFMKTLTSNMDPT